MLSLITQLSFGAVLLGWLATLWLSLGRKEYRKTALLALVPFYAVGYVLKLKEAEKSKKPLAILVLGGLLVFFFSFLLELLLTPPV